MEELLLYQKKQIEYQKGLRDLYLDKVKGIISEDDFISLSKEFNIEKDRLERSMNHAEIQIAEIEEKMKSGNNRRQIVEQYANLKHLNREIVDKLIDYITVGKKIPSTKEVPIEIHWNF